jgi:molybdopterin-guanine dinucleotide biosynthesis protein A
VTTASNRNGGPIGQSAKPKHAALARPSLGEFGRFELAVLGTPCDGIKRLAVALMEHLEAQLRVAYVDADHKGEEGPGNPFLQAGATLHYNDKIAAKRFDYRGDLNPYQIKPFFAGQDLVLVNGNHFAARSQVAVVDPAKPLEKKLDKLTDVRLVLLASGVTEVPAYLVAHLQNAGNPPVLPLHDTQAISRHILQLWQAQLPPLHGLVLAGGLSTRMQRDKGLLHYYGQPQREYAASLLARYCHQVYLSCRPDQVPEPESQFPLLPDTFMGLGPKGGILSALRHQPDAAWLVVACDLPLLDDATLHFLVTHRDPSRVATAFLDAEGKFPEPLVTIYEPRSYPVLLQMLGLGYSCPRKTLINHDVALLRAPNAKALTNVNDPGEYEKIVRELES